MTDYDFTAYWAKDWDADHMVVCVGAAAVVETAAVDGLLDLDPAECVVGIEVAGYAEQVGIEESSSWEALGRDVGAWYSAEFDRLRVAWSGGPNNAVDTVPAEIKIGLDRERRLVSVTFAGSRSTVSGDTDI